MTEQTETQASPDSVWDEIYGRLANLYESIDAEETTPPTEPDSRVRLKTVTLTIAEQNFPELDPRLIKFLTAANPHNKIQIQIDNRPIPWLRIKNIGTNLEIQTRKTSPLLQTNIRRHSNISRPFIYADKFIESLRTEEGKEPTKAYKVFTALLDGVKKSAQQQGLLKQPTQLSPDTELPFKL